jgi:hypothetical protein
MNEVATPSQNALDLASPKHILVMPTQEFLGWRFQSDFGSLT